MTRIVVFGPGSAHIFHPLRALDSDNTYLRWRVCQPASAGEQGVVSVHRFFAHLSPLVVLTLCCRFSLFQVMAAYTGGGLSLVDL
jgi:hypothetical protein